MNKLIPLYLLFVIVVVAQIIFGIVIWISFDSMCDRGTFGDMFGAVNALFSGLAFCGVIYAIFLQRKELELQREELTLTRKELKKSADAQQKISEENRKFAIIQEKTFEMQTCSNLLNYYNEVITSGNGDPVSESQY